MKWTEDDNWSNHSICCFVMDAFDAIVWLYRKSWLICCQLSIGCCTAEDNYGLDCVQSNSDDCPKPNSLLCQMHISLDNLVLHRNDTLFRQSLNRSFFPFIISFIFFPLHLSVSRGLINPSICADIHPTLMSHQ